MSDQFAAVIVKESTNSGTVAVAPATYPVTEQSDAVIAAQLEVIRAELATGNVGAAIRGAQLISGRGARQGDRKLASMLRQTVRATRRGDLTEANELLSVVIGR